MSIKSRKYQYLDINGPLSIVPTTPKELIAESCRVFILMGPTGSGKSAFIERLSPDVELSISKDSLDSVTQKVVCYRVANIRWRTYNHHVILMDTPGFLDTKLSESRVTRMVTEKLAELHKYAKVIIACILYFQPITDIRMGGSKRKALKLLHAFVKSFGAKNINVVTTMWNMISTPKQVADANQRFDMLESWIMEESTRALEIRVTRFGFTEESSLSVLDGCWYGWSHNRGMYGDIDVNYRDLVRNGLLERIESTQQRLQLLAEERRYAASPGIDEILLLEIIDTEQSVLMTSLKSFLDDLYEIDPAACCSPLPPLPRRVLFKHRLKSFSRSLKKYLDRKGRPPTDEDEGIFVIE